ncbi:MAG: L-histidine N(alpha)-methyltransferase [Rhodospirillales bacterium]
MDTNVQIFDCPAALKPFRDDVFMGLSKPQKELPCKYFYDAQGSELFNAICRVDEYYPTRTEIALLKTHGVEIADLIGAGVCLIEYGCGSLVKTRILLDALKNPDAFVPIDISEEHLIQSVREFADEYEGLDVRPLVTDFTKPVTLPEKALSGGARRVGFFPGSTIGNFDHGAAKMFLKTIADTLGSGGALLIGVDLKKDAAILNRAYDDAAGVTAAFNLNILGRINRELDGGFDLGGFRHEARYDADIGRVEMHLASEKEQTVEILGRDFRFRKGETIHTENSYKYTIDEFSDLAGSAGFLQTKTWTDDNDLFSIHFLVVE